MYSTPEQLSEINKQAIESSLRMVRASLEALGNFAALQAETAGEAASDWAGVALETSCGIRDLKGLHEARDKWLQKGMGRSVAYAQNLYGWLGQSREQVGVLVETEWRRWNQTVMQQIDVAAQDAPAGAHVVIAAVKSAVAATSNAMDEMTQAAEKVARVADAGFKASVEAMMGATGEQTAKVKTRNPAKQSAATA